MRLKEFDEFEKDPSPEFAMKLGCKLVEMGISTEQKRLIFKKAFKISFNNDLTDAIINMWAVAAMLESSLPIPEKIMAVRGFLNDENITVEMIEKWVRVVYSVKRAPSDMLEFIAIDIRNLRGISKEIRKMLGHPNPDKPFTS
jgi:hypothetical protein